MSSMGMEESITAKLQVFTNKCVRKILRIFWPNQITNIALWKRTNQPRIDLQIRKCKWGWLGHTLRKSSDDIARQTLEWNPQGKWGRGWPKNTWWRTVLEEAMNSVRWKILVEALCSAAEWRDAIYMGMEGDGCRQFHDTWLAVINRCCDQHDPPESTYVIFIKTPQTKAFFRSNSRIIEGKGHSVSFPRDSLKCDSKHLWNCQ